MATPLLFQWLDTIYVTKFALRNEIYIVNIVPQFSSEMNYQNAKRLALLQGITHIMYDR